MNKEEKRERLKDISISYYREEFSNWQDSDVLRSYYRDYVKKYDQLESYIKRYGEIPEARKMTYEQFVTNLKVKFELKVDNNEYEGLAKITKNLAKSDVYQMSSKQASKAVENMIRLGLTNKTNLLALISQLRIKGIEGTDFEKSIKERYAELRQKGFSGIDAGEIIGQEYYGS